MGFNTQIQIGNDQWHHFKENPEELVKYIEEGMNSSPSTGEAADFAGGYIKVMPSRHADEFVLMVANRNMFTHLSMWAIQNKARSGYYASSRSSRIELDESLLKQAQEEIKNALKEIRALKALVKKEKAARIALKKHRDSSDH